jgi:O-methyltransferase
MIIKPLNKILRKFDLSLQRVSFNNSRVLEYPVEINSVEKAIIDHVINPSNSSNALTMTSIDRLWAAISSIKYVVENKIEGDIVECGVWRGGCSLAMAMMLKELGSKKKVFLFDTFEGMTKPTTYDIDAKTGIPAINTYNSLNCETHNEWCYASLEDVKHHFNAAGLTEYPVYVQGDVLETLRNADNLPNKVSLVRLDTDWYESTKYEMEVLYPLLQCNGVLLVDDYGHWQGSRRAVDEYFASLAMPAPLIWKTDYTGRGCIKLCQ